MEEARFTSPQHTYSHATGWTQGPDKASKKTHPHLIHNRITLHEPQGVIYLSVDDRRDETTEIPPLI